MVTIREVAKEAGVSIGTVSRVINNKPGVSDQKRQHVLAVIQELGYVPPKRLPLSASRVTHLGVVIRPTEQSLTADPFYGDIFQSTEQTCHELQISVFFSTLNIVNDRLRTLPALVNDDRISGIIMLGALPLDVVEAFEDAVQLPLVLIDNWYPDCAWDSVMIDNLHGAHLATKHLIANGHRHITMLKGPDHPSIVERREGYEKTLQEHNLTPTIISTPDLTTSDGEWAAGELLRQAPDTTAIFCTNDNQAIGALVKFQQLGFKIPDDISIVGFDDVRIVKFTSPPITTIHVDRSALGQVATELLLGRINNPDRAIIKTIVGTELIERASVSTPRCHPIHPLEKRLS